MAYFNHAFSKRFLGTGATLAPQTPTVTNPAATDGFITTEGVSTSLLATLGTGYYGFFTKDTFKSVGTTYLSGNSCCPLILASASVLANDKIGPFHGGYKESNKSKVINPKYVSKLYVVEECAPQQAVVSIGNTPYTDDVVLSLAITAGGTGYVNGVYTNVPLTGGTGSGATANITISGGIIIAVSVVNSGTGYTNADILAPSTAVVGTPTGAAQLTATVSGGVNCCKEFFCDETYYLRLDLKGSPALRFLNHQAYQTVDAYTGCCTGPTPTAVDSTLVFIQWAEKIVQNPYIKDFIFPVVYDETGAAWYPPGSTIDPLGVAILPANWWSNYVSPGHTPNACAGMRLFGAYVETKFGNCSFQLTDFFEKEPVKILASLVDYTGDPCVFEGLCVVTECYGLQGMGFGEQVVRDFILSESYLQNFFHSDIRIREITQGDQLLNAINRNSLYTRYYILHNVPRFNNPTGVFDNDQYMLEIITNGRNATLETFLTTWLGNCTDCVDLEVFSCDPCSIIPTSGIVVP